MLDESQARIASHLYGGLLVLAPVGTGKTTALIERIGRALDSNCFQPERILTLTFTNRAANEVQERVGKRFPAQAERLLISTFHGLCAQILRNEARIAGLPTDFAIADESDCIDLLREIGPREAPDARRLYHEIQQAKASLQSKDLTWPLEHDRLFARFGQAGGVVYRYQDELARQGLLDFGDLVLLVNGLFARQPEVRAYWSRRFDLVQVDEVQDTHRSEYRVVYVLAKRSGNLAFFGDVDQTIYAWRGSDPSAILEQFARDFGPIAEMKLEHNRRSTRRLVAAADGFARSLAERRTSVRPHPSSEDGERLVLYRAPDPTAEAQWIATSIGDLVQRDGIPLGRISVLTGTNQRGVVISDALQRAGVPHLTVEELEFFRRQEIKDVLAYLRLLLNPADSGAVVRVLERFTSGVGSGTIARLRRTGDPLGLRLVDLLSKTTLTTGDPFGDVVQEYRQGSIVVLDVETTGLDGPRVELVEVAAARLEAGRVVDRFEALVRSELGVGASEAIHGISDARLAERGRPAREVLEELLDFAGDSLLVGHNIGFDLRVLGAECRRHDLPTLGLDGVDTLMLARRFLEARDYSLVGLARLLNLEHQPEHRAAADVAATCALLERLVPLLEVRQAERRALVAREEGPFADLAIQLDNWQKQAQALRPPDLLELVLEESGLRAHYADDPRRRRNLADLVQAFVNLDNPQLDPASALREAVSRAALVRNLEQVDDRDRVRIITIHQAKGMEFDAVFIAGLVDGELPRGRAVRDGRLEEERRLFYVALTRARRRLFLSTHARGLYGRARPSPFLDYLDADLLEVVEGAPSLAPTAT